MIHRCLQCTESRYRKPHMARKLAPRRYARRDLLGNFPSEICWDLLVCRSLQLGSDDIRTRHRALTRSLITCHHLDDFEPLTLHGQHHYPLNNITISSLSTMFSRSSLGGNFRDSRGVRYVFACCSVGEDYAGATRKFDKEKLPNGSIGGPGVPPAEEPTEPRTLKEVWKQVSLHFGLGFVCVQNVPKENFISCSSVNRTANQFWEWYQRIKLWKLKIRLSSIQTFQRESFKTEILGTYNRILKIISGEQKRTNYENHDEWWNAKQKSKGKENDT